MAVPVENATSRFTDRVDDYVRWRPSYPLQIVELIARETGIAPPAAVADVGSGTGISAELFLAAGYEVWGIEPNAAMRQAAETQLSQLPSFHSVNGSSDATTLPAAGIDLVIAAQAFHWFDPERARREFQRILRPPGWVALVWNSRRLEGSPFLREYEELLLEFGTDYAAVRHENVDAARLQGFFGGAFQSFRLEQAQRLDRTGLEGRLRSSSYAPAVDHPRHAPMLIALNRLFAAHAQAGAVVMEYDVELHIGRIISEEPGTAVHGLR